MLVEAWPEVQSPFEANAQGASYASHSHACTPTACMHVHLALHMHLPSMPVHLPARLAVPRCCAGEEDEEVSGSEDGEEGGSGDEGSDEDAGASKGLSDFEKRRMAQAAGDHPLQNTFRYGAVAGPARAVA